MNPIDLNADAIVACADLARRAGASGFEIRHDGNTKHPRWHATATYRGARIMVDNRHSPTEAAIGLAERLLRGASCKCGRKTVLSGEPGPGQCRWRLMGPRWEPGCNTPPITVNGERGDLAAMRAAFTQAGGK